MVSAGENAYRTLRLRAAPISAKTLSRLGRWLFLIPHQDDETLGCGGLIHALARMGARPVIAYLTDGTASHRGSPAWPASRLASRRRQEALAALRILGVPQDDVIWLGWHDAEPYEKNSHAWRAQAERLSRLCRSARIRAIASTWDGEPHCDHAAAASLAQGVTGGAVAHYAYLVWGWTLPDLPRRLARCDLRRLNVSQSRGSRKRALALHRTQTGGMIDDAAEAFRLPPAMAKLTDRDSEILIRVGRR